MSLSPIGYVSWSISHGCNARFIYDFTIGSHAAEKKKKDPDRKKCPDPAIDVVMCREPDVGSLALLRIAAITEIRGCSKC